MKRKEDQKEKAKRIVQKRNVVEYPIVLLSIVSS